MYSFGKCFKAYSWYYPPNLEDEVAKLHEGICKVECTTSRLNLFGTVYKVWIWNYYELFLIKYDF